MTGTDPKVCLSSTVDADFNYYAWTMAQNKFHIHTYYHYTIVLQNIELRYADPDTQLCLRYAGPFLVDFLYLSDQFATLKYVQTLL